MLFLFISFVLTVNLKAPTIIFLEARSSPETLKTPLNLNPKPWLRAFGDPQTPPTQTFAENRRPSTSLHPSPPQRPGTRPFPSKLVKATQAPSQPKPPIYRTGAGGGEGGIVVQTKVHQLTLRKTRRENGDCQKRGLCPSRAKFVKDPIGRPWDESHLTRSTGEPAVVWG